MQKLIKNPLFTFILGVVISIGITSVFAYSLLAPDIGYTPLDTTWKKTDGSNIENVQEAIDDLRETAHRFGYVKGAVKAKSGTTIPVEIGSYIVITGVDGASVSNSVVVSSPAWGGVASGVGAYSSVHKATATSVTVTMPYGRDFNYYVFR